MKNYLLMNFGGPRDLEEITPFLSALLCDRDVVRTRFPPFVHNWLFRRVARKRAGKISHDYEQIGGRSPIYFDTEALAKALAVKLGARVVPFHRYLPATHAETLRKVSEAEEWIALPLFPQFSYATTGSIARFFSKKPLLWIKSYAGHEAFVKAYQKRIGDFLREQNLREKEILLLFSAHGLPRTFVEMGDPYETECQLSYQAVMQAFPQAKSRLCYQSKFGRGEWLRPYTDESCEQILNWNEGRKHIVFVPISFTSDHIETLFEVEKLYLPILREKGLCAHRCPALNLEPYWIDALAEIANNNLLYNNDLLIY